MVFLGRPTILAAPRRSQLGVAGAVVASIIQAAAAVTMATIQLVYQEYAERRARKQWERDQRSRAAELERQTAELTARNTELENYLTSVTGGTTGGGGGATAAVSSVLQSPWLPYVVVGGIAVVLLTRRKP